jgi:hypothetical protein
MTGLQQRAHELLQVLTAGVDPEILTSLTMKPEDEDNEGESDFPLPESYYWVTCPYCSGRSEHRPSCVTVRAQTLLGTAADQRADFLGACDLLLEFVLRDSYEGQVWGGINHDGTTWLCVYCRNRGSVYYEDNQHFADCPVQETNRYLQAVSVLYPAWGHRWSDEEQRWD